MVNPQPAGATSASGGSPSPKRVLSGGTGGKPAKRRKSPNGSTITTSHGGRVMKAYPITESELRQLFGFGLFAAICFSLSLELFRFGLDIYKDIHLTDSIPQKTVETWSTYMSYCWWGAALSAVLLFIFMAMGHHKIAAIKKGTAFDEP